MPKTGNSLIRGDRFFTLSEAQNFLGIRSRKTILKYITRGSLSAYKVGGTRWRISLRDIDSFLANYKTGSLDGARGVFSGDKQS